MTCPNCNKEIPSIAHVCPSCGEAVSPELVNQVSGQEIEQKLSAITIEHHRKKDGKLGHLIGTRINVHLGLIQQFLPGILDELLAKFNE